MVPRRAPALPARTLGKATLLSRRRVYEDLRVMRRSDPQMLVVVIRTSASFGCSSLGCPPMPMGNTRSATRRSWRPRRDNVGRGCFP